MPDRGRPAPCARCRDARDVQTRDERAGRWRTRARRASARPGRRACRPRRRRSPAPAGAGCVLTCSCVMVSASSGVDRAAQHEQSRLGGTSDATLTVVASIMLERARWAMVCSGWRLKAVPRSPNCTSRSTAATCPGCCCARATARLLASAVLPDPPLGDTTTITFPEDRGAGWGRTSAGLDGGDAHPAKEARDLVRQLGGHVRTEDDSWRLAHGRATE